jgi:transposase
MHTDEEVALPKNGGRGTQRGWSRGSERVLVPYRRYAIQFKDEACRLAAGSNYNPARAAKELGVPEMTLRSWMKQRKMLPESNKPQTMFTEDSQDIQVVRMQLREAQRRIQQLEMEKEILKKATAFFAKEQP